VLRAAALRCHGRAPRTPPPPHTHTHTHTHHHHKPTHPPTPTPTPTHSAALHQWPQAAPGCAACGTAGLLQRLEEARCCVSRVVAVNMPRQPRSHVPGLDPAGMQMWGRHEAVPAAADRPAASASLLRQCFLWVCRRRRRIPRGALPQHARLPATAPPLVCVCLLSCDRACGAWCGPALGDCRAGGCSCVHEGLVQQAGPRVPQLWVVVRAKALESPREAPSAALLRKTRGWPRPAGHPPARPAAAAAALHCGRCASIRRSSTVPRCGCSACWCGYCIPPACAGQFEALGAAAALGCDSGAGFLVAAEGRRGRGWRCKAQPQQHGVPGSCTLAAARRAGGRSPPAGLRARSPGGMGCPRRALQRSADMSAQDFFECRSDVAALRCGAP
jgi:hypothetical protein